MKLAKKILLYVLIFVACASITCGIIVIDAKIKYNRKLEQIKTEASEGSSGGDSSGGSIVETEKTKAMNLLISASGEIVEKHTISASISENILGKEIKADADIEINLQNFENSKIKLVGNITNYAENFEVVYVDGMLYLACDGIQFKTKVSSIMEMIVVMKNVVPELSPVVALIDSLSTQDILQSVIGDPTAVERIISVKDGSYSELADGKKAVTYNINLSEILNIQKTFVLDVVYNSAKQFESIKLVDLQVGNFKISPKININNDKEISISAPNGDNYFDLDWMPKLSNAIINTFANKAVTFNANLNIANNNDEIKLALENAGIKYINGKFMFKSNMLFSNKALETMNANVKFNGDTLFVDAVGQKIKIQSTAIMQSLNTIISMLSNNQTSLSGLTQNVEISGEDLVGGIKLILLSIDKLEVIDNGNDLSLDINFKNGINIHIAVADNIMKSVALNNVTISNSTVSAKLDILDNNASDVVVENEEEYVDLTEITSLVDAFSKVVSNKKMAFNADVAVKSKELNTNVSLNNVAINFANFDNLLLSGSLSVDELKELGDVKLNYQDGTIYANIPNINKRIKIDNQGISQLIGVIRPLLPEIQNSTLNLPSSMLDVVKLLESGLKINVEKLEDGNKFTVLFKNNDITGQELVAELIVVVNGNNELSKVNISFKNGLDTEVIVNVDLLAPNTDVQTLPQEEKELYDINLNNSIEHVKGIVDLVSAKKMQISGQVNIGGKNGSSINLGGVSLNPTSIMLNNGYLSFSNGIVFDGAIDTVGGIETHGNRIRYEDNQVYASLLGKFNFKMGISAVNTMAIGEKAISINDIFVVLNSIKEINFAEVDANGLSVLTITVDGKALGLADGETIAIEVVSSSGKLVGLNLEEVNIGDVCVSANIRINADASLAEPEQIQGEFSSLDNIGVMINGAKALSNMKNLQASGFVQLGETVRADVSNFAIDFENDVIASGDIAISKMLDMNANIIYRNGYIYANALNQKMLISQNSLLEIMQNLGVTLPNASVSQVDINISSILAMIEKIDSITVSDDGTTVQVKFDAEKLLGNKFSGNTVATLVVSNEKIENISLSGLIVNNEELSLSVALEKINDAVVAEVDPQEYVNMDKAPALVNAIKQIIDTKKVELSGAVNVSGGNVNTLKATIPNFKIDLSRGFAGLAMSGRVMIDGDIKLAESGIIFEDGTAYVDLSELKLKIGANPLFELIKQFVPNFNIGSLSDIDAMLEKPFDLGAIVGVMNSIKIQNVINDDQNKMTTYVIDIKNSLFGVQGDNGEKMATVEVTVSYDGALNAVNGVNFMSEADGNTIDFCLKLEKVGDGVVVDTLTSEQKNDYVNFDSIGIIINALKKTAELTNFDLSADVNVTRADNTKWNFKPEIKITAPVDKTQGFIENLSGQVDLSCMGPVLGQNLGVVKLWYKGSEKQIYAKVSDLNIKVAQDSIFGILQAVLDGTGMGGDVNIVDIVNMLTSNENLIKTIASSLKSIETLDSENGKTIVAVIDGSVLYDGFVGDVVVSLDINNEGYFTKLAVSDVVGTSNDRVNFTINLNNPGSSIQPDAVDEANYIDISAIEPVVKSFLSTAKLRDFHIQGNINMDIDFLWVKNLTRNIDVKVKVNEDGSIKAISATTSGSMPCTHVGNFGARTHNHEGALWYENGMVSIRYKVIEHKMWVSCKETMKVDVMTMQDFMTNIMDNLMQKFFGLPTEQFPIDPNAKSNLFAAIIGMGMSENQVGVTLHGTSLIGASTDTSKYPNMINGNFDVNIAYDPTTFYFTSVKIPKLNLNVKFSGISVKPIANVDLNLINPGTAVDPTRPW